VLCFERKLFEEHGVFQGLSLDVKKYLPVVTSSSNLAYLNRTDAEQNTRFKQSARPSNGRSAPQNHFNADLRSD
jgi:hypothetical protein